jgi:hypothetical protein
MSNQIDNSTDVVPEHIKIAMDKMEELIRLGESLAIKKIDEMKHSHISSMDKLLISSLICGGEQIPLKKPWEFLKIWHIAFHHELGLEVYLTNPSIFGVNQLKTFHSSKTELVESVRQTLIEHVGMPNVIPTNIVLNFDDVIPARGFTDELHLDEL